MEDVKQYKNNEKPVNDVTTEACTNDKDIQDDYMKLTYGERFLKALNACTGIKIKSEKHR